MECNRDEATRAKEIAEKKFTAKDILGAKKFAAKAHSLYPGLEGIQQMVSTLNVHVSAENRINGEADWYGILGVNQQADEETVRKQYRKLALMLHPDKNKSIGAEGAFKLISEAWSLLSDKAKRLAYDQKRNTKSFQQKVTPPSGGSSATPGSNGFYNFAKTTTSQTKRSTAKAGASSVPAAAHRPKPNTFWTVCHRCKMQYEYLRIYLNHNLLCPNCHDPFLAVETPPPASHVSKYHSPQRQSSNHKGASKNVSTAGRSSGDSYSHTNFQWGPFSRTAGAPSAAQAATVVQQAYEKVKREREEAQAATKREEALQRKNNASRKTGGLSSSGYSTAMKRRKGGEDLGRARSGKDSVNQMATNAGGPGTTGSAGVKQGSSETERASGANKVRNSRDTSHLDIQNLLMEKARMVICKKLNEWKSATFVQSAVEARQEFIVKDSVMINDGRQGGEKIVEPVKVKDSHVNKSSPGSSGGNLDKDSLQPLSINVPDPDFHDFDKDRTEKCFGENQVWAAYDDDDGMPRYYAMIHNVISLNPFKMRISWLNSKTNSELGPLNWVGSGFSKTCGDFRIGKHEINNSLNSFSHKVKWMKGARGIVHIFPRKGDVWALYRNWSPDWNELTADEVIHKYDMVEVLEDYDEELGVTVTPLVKVAGFKTVFHQHLDLRQIRRIPREEMFCFSHHVPSYLLTGQEAPHAPKGCRELDPAATPLELLQVITDVKEEDIVGKEETDKLEKVEIGVGQSNNREKEGIHNGCRQHILDTEMEEVEVLETKLKMKEDMQVGSDKEKTVNFSII